jgi:KUP system potassium uptake protein
MRDLWRWPRAKAWPLSVLFLAVDLTFFAANAVKIEHGGWFPIVVAFAVFALLSTWKRGRGELAVQLRNAGLPLDMFLGDLGRSMPHRVKGTAVFMTSNVGTIPPVMLHHLKHNKVLHERVILVSIMTLEVPSVTAEERVEFRALGHGFFQVIARYGFMESPDVPALLASLPPGLLPGPRIEKSAMETTYYLGRETLLPGGPSRMARWRKRLFIIMARNAQTASAFFGLPPNRVVELGAQIQL